MRGGRDTRSGSGRNDGRWSRLRGAYWALVLASLALLIGAVLAGSARPLLAQEPGGTAATDRAALLTLYAATDGPNWTDNTNWGSDAPLSDWHGVSVNAEGRVTGLRLERNNLTGTLPGDLGDLAALEDLGLSSNQLHGPVFPPRWADLISLRTLDLGHNQFSGPIPPELGNLANLRVLVLYGNQLRGPIPPELGNLPKMERLYLRQNQLSGSIPAELGNLANLGGLFLSGNQLSGPIPPALGNLPNLRDLDLGRNQLSGPIPPALATSPTWGACICSTTN